jgi:hypothetical protein
MAIQFIEYHFTDWPVMAHVSFSVEIFCQHMDDEHHLWDVVTHSFQTTLPYWILGSYSSDYE